MPTMRKTSCRRRLALRLRLRVQQIRDTAAADEHSCESVLRALGFHLVGYCRPRIHFFRIALRQVWPFCSLGSLSQSDRRCPLALTAISFRFVFVSGGIGFRVASSLSLGVVSAGLPVGLFLLLHSLFPPTGRWI